MGFALTHADVLSVLALLVSGYAAWKTIRFNERQRSLIESQERLTQRLIAKQEEDSRSEKRADVRAAFIRLGSNNYRLKVWNQGRATARDVGLEFPEGNDCIADSDIEAKFPLELLELHQSVELIAVVSLETRSKRPITLRWSDDFSSTNQKTVYPTL